MRKLIFILVAISTIGVIIAIFSLSDNGTREREKEMARIVRESLLKQTGINALETRDDDSLMLTSKVLDPEIERSKAKKLIKALTK